MRILRPINRSRLYEEVVGQIVDLIRSGQIRPGERLPSERELEGQLKVSRGVLREAFRVLESRGLITSRPGGGRFLRDLPSLKPGEVLDHDWLTVRLEQAVILDLWETREALEVKAAELAAKRATPEDIMVLRELADRMLKDLPIAEAVAIDKQFHLGIAAAAHNGVLFNMIQSQVDLLTQIRGRVLSGLGRVEPEDFPRDHHTITDAIESGEPGLAREMIIAHLRHNRRKYETHDQEGKADESGR